MEVQSIKEIFFSPTKEAIQASGLFMKIKEVKVRTI